MAIAAAFRSTRREEGVSGMSRSICRKYRMLRLCILPLLMLFLTGCAACSKERVIECLKYIELLSTDRKFRDILAYGIEGKHFEYLENGTVLTTQTGIDRYATRLYQTGSFVNASVASVSRDILADPDQWEKVFAEYDTKGIYSKTHGFHYSESRKESIITALQAIFGDYSTELCTGSSDPDVVIPEMRARMEAAGFDELLADVQDQINEWFADGH